MMGKPTLHFVFEETITAQLWAPVMEQASSRGLQFTSGPNPNVVADIGFYADDYSIPGPQSLTLISPNGLDQIHDSHRQPEAFFLRENWSLFDLGLLPGPIWERHFLTATRNADCQPKIGAVVVGWPKSDALFPKQFNQQYRIDGNHKRRILYAPNIECDGKQDEVISALQGLHVELVVKHWESAEEAELYPGLLTHSYLKNLTQVNERANHLDWVTVLSPSLNFVDVASTADLLITDQSSVMTEALLCGVPTIAVSDWRHNCGSECDPSRDEACLVVERAAIRDGVKQVLDNYADFARTALRLRDVHFSNLGTASSEILDTALRAWHLKNDLVSGLRPLSAAKFFTSDRQLLDQLSKLRYQNRRLALQNHLLREANGLVVSSKFVRGMGKLFGVVGR